jgi:hypothetical protein
MILTGKSYWYFLLLAIFATQLAMAQGTGKLKGKIIDEEDGLPLIGASVMIVGSYKGTVTDVDGNYLLTDIKPGDYSVKIQFLGYGTKQFTGISIKEGQTTTLNVKLSSSREVLQTVTVVGRKEQVDLEKASSEINFSKDDISKLNVRNVAEIISTQAGVSQSPDGIQIRGAVCTKQNTW